MRKSIVLTAAALFTAASALSPSDAVAKPKVSNVSVTKATDKASPNLFRANNCSS
jgi:type VI protein secretion system component Hcp